ncbi:MAG: MgtC/SapB family protein [Chloroflexi bacterium]|nr:MgtC/SapB family protein [Chloroflexota bacterium]
MPTDGLSIWGDVVSLQRLALALGLGLLIGAERERAGKEIGLRTFAFVALTGAMGAMIDPLMAVAVMGVVALLVVFLNLYALVFERQLELTTSAALFVTAMLGILAGRGEFFVPTAAGMVTAALLFGKMRLHGFTLGLSNPEVRAALTFGIIAFVIYPILPPGYADPWQLINPRAAWLTVLLIAGIGLVNYVLLRSYGPRGLTYAVFLGGLVNSSIAVAELARRLRESTPGRSGSQNGALALHGLALANVAMLLRNGAILAILAPSALASGLQTVAPMVALSIGVVMWSDRRVHQEPSPQLQLESPFSLRSALYFGAILVALAAMADLAQRQFGDTGFYVVSLAGGLVSSASTTASAAILTGQGKLSPDVAGVGVALASAMSAAVHAPIVWRASESAHIGWRVAQLTVATLVVATVGFVSQSTGSVTLAGVWPWR